jgi:putative NADH-flavin reductase
MEHTMKLFLVGATGRTGQLVAEQAVARGHAVTAIIRPSAVRRASKGLELVVGDPLRADDLAPAVAGHDAVVSCLGQGSRADASLLRDGARAMLQAMRRSGVRRYLVVSQGLLFASANPVIKLLRWILARHVADSTAMEDLVRKSDVGWTIVRPPRLTDGGAHRGYRLQVGALPRGAWSMRRADLATYLIDEAESGAHAGAIVGVTSA